MTVHTITEPPSLHILWQIPQYVVVTAGEVSIFLEKKNNDQIDSMIFMHKYHFISDHVLCNWT